jgi:hypothetical protein
MLCLQHVSSQIYKACYPYWIFIESWFKQCLLVQFELIADFEGSYGSGYFGELTF